MRCWICAILFFPVSLAVCQPRFTCGDATVAFGNSEGTLSFLFTHGWRPGKNEKFEVGIGLRFTSYLGQNQYYITAPANLTSGATGPQVIFKENIPENIDSLLINWPQINALNLAIHLGYQINSRFTVGFTIDALGFSFGKSTSARYINGAFGQTTSAKPTAFNFLLVSDNDLGSLNSELFAKYYWNERWGIKAGAQFLFTEYTTQTEVQQVPEPNDRFRDKSLLIALAITRSF